MNKYIAVLLISVCVVLTGCGSKGDTSSGGASADLSRTENSVTTDSGATIFLDYDQVVSVNDVVNVNYAVRNTAGVDHPGTLHWGDYSADRVRSNGSLNHIYRSPGTYQIAIQQDGEEKAVVGSITVQSFTQEKGDCKILSFEFFPSSGTISRASGLHAIVDYEVSTVSLSPTQVDISFSSRLLGRRNQYVSTWDYGSVTQLQVRVDKGQIRIDYPLEIPVQREELMDCCTAFQVVL